MDKTQVAKLLFPISCLYLYYFSTLKAQGPGL